MKSIIFWDVMPCSLLSYNRRFRETYCLHLQGRRNNFRKNQQASRWQAAGNDLVESGLSPNFRNCPSMCLEGLRRTTKDLSHDSECCGLESNREPHDHELEVSLLERTRSVFLWRVDCTGDHLRFILVQITI
jgi:hypothetical protein